MRTKWQSGTMAGNTIAQHLRGNHLIGDERRAVGKTNPYLSRKIYLRSRPVQYLNDNQVRIHSLKDKKKKKNGHWPLRVFLLAVALSAVLSFCSGAALEGAGLAVALIVLAAFIALGIVFDMIGVAVTAADPRPFHSMAAHKEKGGREAIRLLNNANRVSSVCNDVVGDICGIVSGCTAAVIVTRLQQEFSTTNVLISIGVTALISGLTIGGKAVCKSIAINECTKVVYRVARIMHALHLYR